MDKETSEKVKALADMLIATLGDCTSKEADEVVRKVALVMYNDLLGIQGDIKKDGFGLCTVYGYSVISNVRFEPTPPVEKG
jgi:hypothetical protein